MIVADDEDEYSTGKIWSFTRKVNAKIEPYLVGKLKYNIREDASLIALEIKTLNKPYLKQQIEKTKVLVYKN